MRRPTSSSKKKNKTYFQTYAHIVFSNQEVRTNNFHLFKMKLSFKFVIYLITRMTRITRIRKMIREMLFSKKLN